jgi:predicted enzyme related to lactoylglutathione lyase
MEGYMANPFVHIELNTDDVKQAKKFYKRVFQWKLEDQKMGPGMVYTTVDVGKGTGGGIQKKQAADAPTAWLPYVEVDSVDKTVGKAKKAGAQILVDHMDVPGIGALGIFVDPTGA